MKRINVLALILMVVMGAVAQKKTTMPTFYRDYRPSKITFTDGHSSRQSLTNVFLKNSSLLFLRGEYTMEADMDNIVKVEFADKEFVNINNRLGYLVDSVGTNALYCIDLFDKDTYERNLKNNVNISSLDLGSDQMSMSTVDINGEDDYKLPVFHNYYYLYNGKFVKVHERDIKKMLSKEKRTMMERVMAVPGFSWQKPESLMALLKAISE